MESFFRTHKYLVEHLGDIVSRRLMDEVDWSHQLIGIKGTRGVGKTTFLLHYARDYFDLERRDCLYINLNHLYFTTCSLVEFARQFVELGGRVLLFDQIHKYPNWSEELRICYELYPSLKIVFTGSTVLKLGEDKEIAKIVNVYNLRGFSYREFLNIVLGKNFEAYTLKEIIENHRDIAETISDDINPNEYLWDYMHHGYYPFFLEKKNFSENLLKTVNMMLEVDVLSIQQIEHSYLSKLRKLLYLLSLETPGKPNISKLSIECEISRATVTNYLEYLKSARLINTLYKEGESFPKKPELVYMHNTNLMFPLHLLPVEDKALNETFFYNQVHHHDCRLNKGSAKGCLIVESGDENYKFKIENNRGRGTQKNDMYHVVNNMTVGKDKVIPLWLFGFLY